MCTAGIAGIYSNWGTFSNVGKLLAVSSFSLIFFGAFWLSHYKLKIINSAKAFYILSIAALGTAVSAAELFGLLPIGDARVATMFLLPTLILSCGIFLGYRIFKTPLFPILGTVLAYTFLIALSASIFDSAAMFFFIPALVSTAGLIYVSLSQKEMPSKLRKHALVLFLIFTLLSAFASPALASQLHQILMVTFALLIAGLMHFQSYQAHHRFIDIAIPAVLTWAALLFSIKLCDNAPAALYICSTVQCASAAATALCARKHGKTPGAIPVTLQAAGILIVWLTMTAGYSYRIYDYAHADLIRCGALVLPALLFLILGARLILRYRTTATATAETADAQNTATENAADAQNTATENAKTDATADTDDIIQIAKAKLRPVTTYGTDACLALVASFIFILFCYSNAPHAKAVITWSNAIFSVGLLSLALIPERFHIGSQRARQFTIFPIFICLAIAQSIIIKGAYHNQAIEMLQLFEFNQLLFLLPACALALIERKRAILRDDKTMAIGTHVAAIGIILWIFPLLLAILDFLLPAAVLSPYIMPADMLLLAVIMLHEPKSPLCPDLSPMRLVSSMILLAISYITASNALLDMADSLPIAMPWFMAIGYVTLILFYTFRKRVACADAPHIRRIIAFSVFIVLALAQIYLRDYHNLTPGLRNLFQTNQRFILLSETNQLFFLFPAFALAVIERKKAIQHADKNIAVGAHVAATCAILWIFPLLLSLLNDAIPATDLKYYILPTDMLLLAVILLHEPKSPLCPNLSKLRLSAAAFLTGISYLITSITLHDQALSWIAVSVEKAPNNPFTIATWLVTAGYAAFILFYTFRKQIAFADAPHIRLRAAIALFTVMSLVQIDPNIRIAAVLLLPAFALTILDDRRSAALQSPKDQTIAAAIGSALVFGIVALVILNLHAIFGITYETQNAIQTLAFSSVALLCALAVLAEHLTMGKKETRPYRLVTAVDFELTAACATLYLIVTWETNLAIRLMLLTAGLIGTACFSHREQRKYGAFAAIAVFAGLYAVLDRGWIHLETAEPDYFLWIATAIITAALAFADGFKRTGYTHLRAVWALATLPLLLVRHDPYHIAHLAGVLIVALNLLQYLREHGKCDHDRILITLSTGIIAVATTIKILILPESSWLPVMIRPELIFLIPLTTAYLVSWRVWKFRQPSHDICSVSALIGLPMLYLIPSDHVLFHAITATVLAVAAILVALHTKLNRYLITGILAIAIIFFSQTQNFWISLHWWVYVAVVGVILLAIAVINETERRKGSTLAKRVKDLAQKAWKW